MNYTKYMISLLALVLLIPVGMSNVFAQSEPGEEDFTDVGPVGVVDESADTESQEIKENIKKIEQFKQEALRNGEIPISELLERVGDKWLYSYKDAQHFGISEEAVKKFVERNNVKDGLDKENAKLISKIHNFETITESVGDGADSHDLDNEYTREYLRSGTVDTTAYNDGDATEINCAPYTPVP